MRFTKTLLLAALIGLMPSFGFAADPALTDAQKAEVESIIRTFLTEKEPELVIKAARSVQEKAEAEEAAKSKQALSKNLDKILADKSSPIGGNPKGDITVIEFFDYMCGYCKMVQPTVEKLIAEDKNIRVMYKEFPILGANSMTASKIALAVYKQDPSKYIAFHNALMTNKNKLDEEGIIAIAKEKGLDADKIKKDMADPEIEKTLKANIALAQELNINGTPSFIVGNKLIPGALQYDQMKELIASLRKAKTK